MLIEEDDGSLFRNLQTSDEALPNLKEYSSMPGGVDDVENISLSSGNKKKKQCNGDENVPLKRKKVKVLKGV